VECLGDDLVLRFAQGQVPATQEHDVQAHLSECEDCRHLVAEAAKALGESRSTFSGSSAPTIVGEIPSLGSHTVGRYQLLEVIGAGGMGVVYTAHDPQLNRKVALKLVRASSAKAEIAAKSRARLLREAQAMAQLAHPNVVAVYDAGTHEGQVFVAMELVEGDNLKLYLKQHRPDWRGAVELFVAAGDGLAAAHARGLVHRDFKPDNVLVGSDGRVRVTDFGLARLELEPEDTPSAEERRAARPLSMTETGMLLGTPAYMAPEQLKGLSVDGRSDQFSFCVALFEALCGRRPYQLTSVDSSPTAFPKDVRVPAAIVALLDRGLNTAPEQRFGSMAELLAGLKAALHEPKKSRAPWAAVIAATVAAIAAGGAALAFATRAPASAPAPAPASDPVAATAPAPVPAPVAATSAPAVAPEPEAVVLTPTPAAPEAAHKNPARRPLKGSRPVAAARANRLSEDDKPAARPVEEAKPAAKASKAAPKPSGDDAPIDNPWGKPP
jgi:hypothetical protein